MTARERLLNAAALLEGILRSLPERDALEFQPAQALKDIVASLDRLADEDWAKKEVKP